MEKQERKNEDARISDTFRRFLRKSYPCFKGIARCLKLAYLVAQVIEWLL